MNKQRWIFAVLLVTALWVAWALPVGADGPTTVTYTYDDAGRLIQAAYSDGTTISYAYDAAGNLLSRIVEQGFEIYLPLVMRSYSG
ncbi:MAG: RHS repeat domain-containing protein [Anaerolineae bacterium]